MDLVDVVKSCAEIPSFSSFEERIHPFIADFLSDIPGADVAKIADNNLVVTIPGVSSKKPVALTAHLDKINHFGRTYPEKLPVSLIEGRLIGQMDDAVGVGMCLYLGKEICLNDKISTEKRPTLLLLLSEMEESFGLKKHPHLLKNQGLHLGPQIGAKRIAAYLDENEMTPSVFVTIDTTPLFKDRHGIALYTEHWEKTNIAPDADLLRKIEAIRSFFTEAYPSICLANGNNDYLEYGRYFGTPAKGNVPSMAIEPAIYPYHQQNEGVFVENVERIGSLLVRFLAGFDFEFEGTSSAA
jgi:hypothetical protein